MSLALNDRAAETSPLLRWAPASVAGLSLLSRGWLGRLGAVRTNHSLVTSQRCAPHKLCTLLLVTMAAEEVDRDTPQAVHATAPAHKRSGTSSERPLRSRRCFCSFWCRHVKSCALSGPRTRISSNNHQLNIPGAPLPRRRSGRPCRLARDNHSMFCAAPLDASAASTAPSVASSAPSPWRLSKVLGASIVY